MPAIDRSLSDCRYENKQPLSAGMVVSCEPGYYEQGEFGIRIENLLVVRCVLHSNERFFP